MNKISEKKQSDGEEIAGEKERNKNSVVWKTYELNKKKMVGIINFYLENQC